jgi:hypothetical protein
MRFKKNTRLHRWETNVTIAGGKVSLSISDSYADSERDATLQETIRKVEKSWHKIQRNIIASLHQTYNSAWAVPEEGFPKLKAKEFAAKIVLAAIDVMEEKAVNLIFADSNVFLGHWVSIFWDSDGKMYQASLQG